MFLHNAINEIKVNAYNEKDVVRDTGGITKKEDNDTIELKILILPTKYIFRQGETGRFEEQPLSFQVSKRELNKNNFEMLVGKTHIIRNGLDYRVMSVEDYSWDPGLQLYRCIAKRMIPVGKLL